MLPLTSGPLICLTNVF